MFENKDDEQVALQNSCFANPINDNEWKYNLKFYIKTHIWKERYEVIVQMWYNAYYCLAKHLVKETCRQ